MGAWRFLREAGWRLRQHVAQASQQTRISEPRDGSGASHKIEQARLRRGLLSIEHSVIWRQVMAGGILVPSVGESITEVVVSKLVGTHRNLLRPTPCGRARYG